MERCLLVAIFPCATPFGKVAILIGLRPVFVNAVVPLGVEDIVWCVPEEQCPILELDFHSLAALGIAAKKGVLLRC